MAAPSTSIRIQLRNDRDYVDDGHGHRIQGEVLELFRLLLAKSRARTSQAGEGYSLPPQIAFTVQEACELLRVSENTMYDVLHRGQIESVRLGHGYRIPRRALEAFMAGD